MPKGKLILITTLVGTIIGITLFLTKPKYILYRLQLEHLEGEGNEYSQFWLQDKAIIFPQTNFIARVYSTFDPTSIENPLHPVSEVKIYLLEDVNIIRVIADFEDYLSDKPINLLNYKKQGELRRWNIILGWIILGFLTGLCIHFIGSFKTKSEKCK